MKRLKKGNVLLGFCNDDFARTMELYFKRKNCNVFVASSQRQIMQILKYNGVNFVLFADEKTPEERLSAAEMIADFDPQICIFFVCNDRSEKDLITAADGNYSTIIKPFAMRNLFQRMSNVAKQRQEKQIIFSSFKIGTYTFNYHKQTLTDTINRKEQHLTKKENEILLNLCQNKDRYVSRHRLLLNVWQKDDFGTSRSMDVYITKLRKYLSLDSDVSIDNRHSVGYKLSVKE